MRFRLTDEQEIVLQMVADAPLRAIPELERHTAPLAAVNLIAQADNATWTITKLGEAMLERPHCPLH